MKKLTLTLIVFLLPVVVLAQGYQPLVSIPLPGGSAVTGASTTFQDYINAVYALSISIAALLAVIKIVIAGVKWMLTDVVTSKGEAKKDIQGALVGLLIVLAAVLIISVINPNITNVTGGSMPPIPAGNTPPPGPAPLPMCPYNSVLVTQSGYTAIPTGSQACMQAQFMADCVSPNIIAYKSPPVSQLQCISPVPAAALAAMTNNLSGLSASQQTSNLSIYQQYISTWEVTNPSSLSTFQANLAATNIYFAANYQPLAAATPGGINQFINQFANVCAAVAQSNGTSLTTAAVKVPGSVATYACVDG